MKSKILQANRRVTRSNLYVASKRYQTATDVIKKACWQVLLENRLQGIHEKNKLQRFIKVVGKYRIFLVMRHWKRQASLESQIKDKSKIEGAYLLLRRFKNRLKMLDEIVRVIHENKVEVRDFEVLKASLQPERAMSVMNDMKLLFDSAVKEFEKRMCAEKHDLTSSYGSILEKQKNMILAFEMKYSNMIKQRLDRLETFTNDLAMEQAHIAARTGMLSIGETMQAPVKYEEDSKLELNEQLFFPSCLSVQQLQTGEEKTSIDQVENSCSRPEQLQPKSQYLNSPSNDKIKREPSVVRADLQNKMNVKMRVSRNQSGSYMCRRSLNKAAYTKLSSSVDFRDRSGLQTPLGSSIQLFNVQQLSRRPQQDNLIINKNLEQVLQQQTQQSTKQRKKPIKAIKVQKARLNSELQKFFKFNTAALNSVNSLNTPEDSIGSIQQQKNEELYSDSTHREKLAILVRKQAQLVTQPEISSVQRVVIPMVI